MFPFLLLLPLAAKRLSKPFLENFIFNSFRPGLSVLLRNEPRIVKCFRDKVSPVSPLSQAGVSSRPFNSHLWLLAPSPPRLFNVEVCLRQSSRPTSKIKTTRWPTIPNRSQHWKAGGKGGRQLTLSFFEGCRIAERSLIFVRGVSFKTCYSLWINQLLPISI